MILNTSGLGNTLTDVAADINNADYGSLPTTLVQGLSEGDGWAWMIAISLGYVGYRLFFVTKRGANRVRGLPSEIKRGRERRQSEAIDKEIEKLEARKPGGGRRSKTRI